MAGLTLEAVGINPMMYDNWNGFFNSIGNLFASPKNFFLTIGALQGVISKYSTEEKEYFKLLYEKIKNIFNSIFKVFNNKKIEEVKTSDTSEKK